MWLYLETGLQKGDWVKNGTVTVGPNPKWLMSNSGDIRTEATQGIPCEDTARWWPSANQEGDLRRNQTWWDSPYEFQASIVVRQSISILYKLPSVCGSLL